MIKKFCITAFLLGSAIPANGADLLTTVLEDGCLATYPTFKNAPVIFADAGLAEGKVTAAGQRQFIRGDLRATVTENTECAVEDNISPTAAISYLWDALDDMFPGQYTRDRNSAGQMVWAIRPTNGGGMDVIIHSLKPAGARIEMRAVK